MALYGLKDQIDFSGSLIALPAYTFQKIKEKLDTNPPDSDWRALIRVSEDRFHIRPEQIELWSPAISGLQSAASRALTELSSQGMTVQQLKDYLNMLHIDTYPLGLCPYENIEIVEQPQEEVYVFEGGQLVIEVKATGHPFPRYQWFVCTDGRNFERLQGRTESILRIGKVTKDNAGIYSCQIHNCDDPKKTKISSMSVVTVSPAPVAADPPGKTFNDDIITGLINLGPLEPAEVVCGSLQDNLRERSCIDRHLITKHPSDLLVRLNEEIVLSVETCGNPPIRYEWYKNGQPLGFYNSCLRIANASPNDFGRYHCVVKNGIVTETSNIANVTEGYPTIDQIAKKSADIILVSQPKSTSTKFGGSVIFSCEARCSLPLRYQWFKDGNPLPGETGPICQFINIQDRRCEGMYQCEVSVDRNGDFIRRLTSVAYLNVEVPPTIENIEYNPSDKVALLIGNYDYRNESPLKAPSSDVHVLSEIFRSMQFRVVSLLNLTKNEIENAVDEFCHLVEHNVYAVFYFCGHGFGENGISYLVPTDAPAGYRAEECVRADLILEKIQQKDPPLIFMIMDICRKRNKVPGTGNPFHFPKKQRGNTVYLYATTLEMNAYEDKRRGLLVHHLEPILRREIGIEALVSELKEEFSRHPKHSSRQIPELQSNLLEPRRSLQDRISTRGQTQAFNRRQMIWDRAHVKPLKQDVNFREVGVKVELDFQSDFSNVLHIFATIKHKGVTSSCWAQIQNITLNVSVMSQKRVASGDRQTCISITSIQDIQKLQDNLYVDLVLTFSLPGSPQQHQVKHVMDFGMPLVSVLKLWRPTNILPFRQPTEQTEDTDSL